MKIQTTLAAVAIAMAFAPAMSAQTAEAEPDAAVKTAAIMPAPNVTYRPGEALPVEFGVRDWKDYYAYGLPAAPAGQTWVLIDDDAYLVNAASGVIDLVIRDLHISPAVS